MANNVAVIEGYVVREAARGFYNARLFCGLVTKDYQDEFKEKGAKKGNEIFVRLPPQFNIRIGSAIQIQDVVEEKVPVTLGEPVGVDFEFNTTELTIDIDNETKEYTKRFVMPAGSRLASKVDADGLEQMALATNNTIVTAATPVLKDFTRAKAILNKQLAPKDMNDRYAIVGSDVESEIVDEVKVIYNNSKAVTDAIKKAEMTEFSGLIWATSDLCYVRTNGAGGNNFAVTYTEGSDQIVLAGADAAGLAVGDVLEFDDSNLVNPEHKNEYVNPLQRTIKAVLPAVDTYQIDPIVGPQPVTSGGLQNASAVPAGTADVLGVAGTKYLMSLVFHKEAYTLTTVDMILPKDGVEMKDRIVMDQISMRFIRQYIITSDGMPNRLDVLYTWTAIHNEWGVRVETPLS